MGDHWTVYSEQLSLRGGKLKKYNSLIIDIIKQDIYINVPSGRPNGSTEWGEFFCGHFLFVCQIFLSYFSTGNAGPSASII